MAWHRACALTEIPENRGIELLVAGRVIGLFHADGGIYAIDGICAHQGGPIAQGHLDGKCVTCPWHGWQYDVTSGVNLLTKKHMLDHFPTETRDGEVWINVSQDNIESQR